MVTEAAYCKSAALFELLLIRSKEFPFEGGIQTGEPV